MGVAEEGLYSASKDCLVTWVLLCVDVVKVFLKTFERWIKRRGNVVKLFALVSILTTLYCLSDFLKKRSPPGNQSSGKFSTDK